MITVINFFAHWIKEIDITKYGSDKQLVPTSSPHEIYQYFDSMLKHVLEKFLKMIEKNFLYSKKMVSYNGNIDRRTHNSNTPADITDYNIDDRIDKFSDVISTNMYRIPLRYFCNLGNISFLVKIDFEIRCNLEMDMKKLFETPKKLTVIGALDTQIIFTNVLFIYYEQFLLTKNFSQYLETILISTKILRMGIQKARNEMQIGLQSFNIDFLGANSQFDWFEISLVFDKHSTIYDSYNVEKAAQFIKRIKLENISEAYSVTNTKKFDTSNETQKHILYKQLVAWNYDGCSIVPITDYIHNSVFRELPVEDKYFGNESDEPIY